MKIIINTLTLHFIQNIKTMKQKLLSSLLIIASIIFISSCSKEDNENTLKGTIWSRNDSSFLLDVQYTEYIEFTDDSNVKAWNTLNRNKGAGTYTIEGNKIKFSNFNYESKQFVEATFSSNSLTMIYIYPDDTDYKYEDIYTKN